MSVSVVLRGISVNYITSTIHSVFYFRQYADVMRSVLAVLAPVLTFDIQAAHARGCAVRRTLWNQAITSSIQPTRVINQNDISGVGVSRGLREVPSTEGWGARGGVVVVKE